MLSIELSLFASLRLSANQLPTQYCRRSNGFRPRPNLFAPSAMRSPDQSARNTVFRSTPGTMLASLLVLDSPVLLRVLAVDATAMKALSFALFAPCTKILSLMLPVAPPGRSIM